MKEDAVPQIWAGVDAGNEHHDCVVIDAEGRQPLSKRVLNDEAALTALIDNVIELSQGETPVWATDLNRGGAALLIALLAERDQHLLYLSGLAVNRAAGIYRGEAKTDARDAAVIADQARMGRDLRPVQCRVSGNLRRPRRYSRPLLRVFYPSALASLRCCGASKAFYQRNRREGKGHKQALLALARRRVNVLWALLRDNALYETRMPRITAA